MNEPICRQCREKMQLRDYPTIVEYMRDSAKDESLSPSLRERIRKWLIAAAPTGDTSE
jgi:hypothetical protein